MKATVITDASFCQMQCVGGWAAWVAIDGGVKLKVGGAFVKQSPANSIQAELMALINGLWVAHSNGALNILLQSDCEGALLVIEGKSRSEALNAIWEDAKRRYSFPDNILTKHVKGHTRIKDARSWVNRWCDTEAKKHMKSLRLPPSEYARRVKLTKEQAQ